jgi:hypothetical protein
LYTKIDENICYGVIQETIDQVSVCGLGCHSDRVGDLDGVAIHLAVTDFGGSFRVSISIME